MQDSDTSTSNGEFHNDYDLEESVPPDDDKIGAPGSALEDDEGTPWTITANAGEGLTTTAAAQSTTTTRTAIAGGTISRESRESFTSADGDDLLCEIWQQRHHGCDDLAHHGDVNVSNVRKMHGDVLANADASSGHVSGAVTCRSDSDAKEVERRRRQEEADLCEFVPQSNKESYNTVGATLQDGNTMTTTSLVPSIATVSAATPADSTTGGVSSACNVQSEKSKGKMGTQAILPASSAQGDVVSVSSLDAMSPLAPVRSISMPGAFYVRPSIVMSRNDDDCIGQRRGEGGSDAIAIDQDVVAALSNKELSENSNFEDMGGDGMPYTGSAADIMPEPPALTLQATKVEEFDVERATSADAELLTKMQQRIAELEEENRNIIASKGIEVATVIVPAAADGETKSHGGNTESRRNDYKRRKSQTKVRSSSSSSSRLQRKERREGRSGRASGSRLSTEQLATEISKTTCDLSSSKIFVLSSVSGLVGIIMTIVIIKTVTR